MEKKNIVLTLSLLMIVLFSGCIAGNETISNNNQIGKDVYSNRTLMFEMKLPAGWKDDAMWNSPYGGVVNFVTDKYPWWPSGDDGAIRHDLQKYGTLSIVQVSMDTQLVPIGYTLAYARSEEMKREEGITYEGNTKLGGEKAWQRIWGRKMLSTSIGGIISALTKKAHTLIEVPKNFPSTKTCSKCGNIQDMPLDKRVYVCENKKCGNIMDRDYNSSIHMEIEGLKQVGTERIELTPAEIESSTLIALRYFNSIPRIKASSVYETGSLTALK